MAKRDKPQDQYDEVPSPNGPIANPVDRFAHLPEHVRKFLEGLDEEETTNLAKLLRNYEQAATIGWFFKWLIVTMAGAFMGVVGIGQAFKTAASWFKVG